MAASEISSFRKDEEKNRVGEVLVVLVMVVMVVGKKLCACVGVYLPFSGAPSLSLVCGWT